LGTLEIQLSFDLSVLFKLSCKDDGIFQWMHTSVGAGSPQPVSGYDWSSLGGEGKITWKVIANKSRVGKKKKFCREE